MSEEKAKGKEVKGDQARTKRLEAALRENLKRRKAQFRAKGHAPDPSLAIDPRHKSTEEDPKLQK